MDKDHIKNYFWKNGYVVLRNIYNDEQIQRYREFIKKNIEEIVGQGKKNWKDIEIKENKDVLSYPEIRDSILNKNLLDAIKSIFDDEDFYYWGYSSFRYNEQSYRSTHNDVKNDNENPFKTKYSLLRIGIYLQDHKNFSNGLKVFKGSSHSLKFGRTLLKKILKEKELRYLFPQRTKPINVDTMPGDVVIWNLRTCHSGNALRLKYFKNISLKPWAENFLEKYLPDIFLTSEKERAVIFSTFGKMGTPLKNFIKDNINHPEIFSLIKNSNFLEQEIISKSEKLGLKILDIEKIKKDI